ncbi:MAG: helix-turn-helix domain-containing protein [Chloroflexi bacterium]|nr:helix-turn-helix domain-containing protein [Chloroflexota bacterium]
MVGERIRQRRKELGLSLRELGVRTNLTASFLSQVENDQSSPSLASLQRIATALQAPMFAFLDGVSQSSSIIRTDERPRLSFSDSGIDYELLTHNLGGQLMAVVIRMQPGSRRIAERLSQPTEEFMHVLRGRLVITIEEQTHELAAGDTICYAGQSLKQFAALGSEEAQVICCIAPPVL